MIRQTLVSRLQKVKGPRVHTSLVVAVLLQGILAAGVVAGAPLDPVVATANMFRDTLLTVAVALVTGGILISAYKMIFSGAQFRDVSNIAFGATLAGAAAAIAGVFFAP